MKYLYIISDDGIMQYRNNGGCFERKALYNNQKKWENVALAGQSLVSFGNECLENGYKIAHSLKEAKKIT